MQTTIKVNEETIKIKTTPKFWKGNFQGYNVKVNDKKYFVATLYANEAQDRGYARYVKETK